MMVNILLEDEQTDINLEDLNGRTPLMYAALSGNKAEVEKSDL